MPRALRNSAANRLRRMRWERVHPQTRGDPRVYKVLQPNSIETTTTESHSTFEMSDEMREALANVQIEPEKQFSEDNGELVERQNNILAQRRYNNGLSLLIDVKFIPWLHLMWQFCGDKEDSIRDISSLRTQHGKVKNCIIGQSVLNVLMESRGAHPVSISFMLSSLGAGFCKSYGQSPIHSHSLGPVDLTKVFYQIRKRLYILNRTQIHLEKSAVKSLWNALFMRKNHPVFRLPEAFFSYCCCLEALSDVQGLQETDSLYAIPCTEIDEAIRIGTLANVYESILHDHEESLRIIKEATSVTSSVGRFILNRSQYQKRNFRPFSDEFPLPETEFEEYCKVVWPIVIQYAQSMESSDEIYKMIKIIAPYVASEPSFWPQELLQEIIGKDSSVKHAYQILKKGVNSDAPKQDSKLVWLPPPRLGITGLLQCCLRNRQFIKCFSTFEFMLQQKCRPGYQDVDAVVQSTALMKNLRQYSNTLKWLRFTPELPISDSTIITSFVAVCDSVKEITISEKNLLFEQCCELLGHPSSEMIFSYLKSFSTSPPSALPFVELLILSTQLVVDNSYCAPGRKGETSNYVLRIGSKELVSSLVKFYTLHGSRCNMMIIKDVIEDCHDQWSGANYVSKIINEKEVLVPSEELDDKSLTSIPFSSVLGVIDVYLLCSFDISLYDLKPFSIYPKIDESYPTVLLHSSSLMWCGDEYLTDLASNNTCVLPVSEYYKFLAFCDEEAGREARREFEDASDSLRALTYSFLGDSVREARLLSLESLNLLGKQKPSEIKTFIEKYVTILPYEEELLLLKDFNGKEEGAFHHMASVLKVSKCAAESPEIIKQLSSNLDSDFEIATTSSELASNWESQTRFIDASRGLGSPHYNEAFHTRMVPAYDEKMASRIPDLNNKITRKQYWRMNRLKEPDALLENLPWDSE